MKKKTAIHFGTDGWRGLIARDFTFENVLIVAQAIADFAKKTIKGKRKIVIGYDRRFLSCDFAKEVASCLAANHVTVALSSSDVPTPVVSFHCLYAHYDLGIMITASHNPAQFNGIKIKTKEGGAADKILTDKVEKLLYRSRPKTLVFEEALKKKKIRIVDLRIPYVDFLKKFVRLAKIKKLKLKILIDTMYGVGDQFASRIINSQSVKIDYIHNEHNPSFNGIHPEPTEKNLQELIKRVKKGRYDLGIALDGDADRIAAVNKNGMFIDAQILLPLLAIHVVKNRKQTRGIGKTVVGSDLIGAVALSLGVPFYETPVGFKYISNLFKEKMISIGGEEAGGIGFKGYIPERDGTASFLMLLEMIAIERKSFDALLKALWKQYGRYYYIRSALPLKKLTASFDALRLPNNLLGRRIERIDTRDGLKLITKKGWLMFRKSGTEPIVRVYAEAKTRKETLSLIALGKKIVQSL